MMMPKIRRAFSPEFRLESAQLVVDQQYRIREGAKDESRSSAQEIVLNDPEALLLQSDGSLLIVDGGNAQVIRLLSDGTIEHFAGRAPMEPEAETI
jgi:hypothetical protein